MDEHSYIITIDQFLIIANRLLDFCLSTSLERHSEVESLNAQKFRSMLSDGIVQISSDVCLAKTVFLNLELTEKLVEPLSWAIQNDSTAFNKVN